MRERVPSGKIITLTRRASRSRHSLSAATALSRWPRRTGTSSAMRIIHPITGIWKIVCFESHFISQGKCDMRKMSAYDSWFDTTT